MANTLAPFGFSQIGRVPGSPAADFALTERLIANANTHAIYAGDLVQDLGTGYIDVSTAGLSQCFGVFLGCEYYNAAVGRIVWSPYWPGSGATGDIKAKLTTDPYALFLVQSTGTNPVAVTDIGANIDISVATAGSANTGQSGMAVNTGLIGTNATYPFRIWALGSSLTTSGANVDQQNTDDTSQYNTALVTFNAMALKLTTGV